MARTRAGRRLTEAHRAAQIKIGAIAAALTIENGRRLDPDDLDGTGPEWERRQALIIETMRQRSAALAREYVEAFREAEGMDPGELAEPVLPSAREAVGWVIPTIKARTARYGTTGG